MMIRRIIMHSNAPWMGSGYGSQTALFVPKLQALGYDMLISTFAGLQGAPLEWNGMTVLPGGQDLYGSDTIPAHHFHANADLVITLLDVWALNAGMVKDVPLACWIPIDTSALGDSDRAFLEISGAIPIAMSRHGEELLKNAGYNPLYVPHGVDTAVFAPRADRDELRERAGLTGKFTVGMLAANKDAIRKSFFPQFEAFARFRRRHCPEAVLLVHSLVTQSGGLDLQRMACECGIEDAVVFSNQYKTLMGLFHAPDVSMWLNTLDVLTNTAMGEGFGLTPLEALACGVPTVVTDTSAMPELALGKEWLVDGDPFWNPTHATRWKTPFIDYHCPQCGYAEGITEVYRQAYERLSDEKRAVDIRAAARAKALEYDVNRVTDVYWRPALTEIDRRLEERKATAAKRAEDGQPAA